MPVIHLTTIVHAPVDRVFDLSRNIALQRKSLQGQRETIINGKTSGLLQMGEEITWQTKRLGKAWTLRLQTARLEMHSFFEEIMLNGDFSKLSHQRHFKSMANGTVMIDLFQFEQTGSWGKSLKQLFYIKYWRQLLEKRNELIKSVAESDKWMHFLN
ncbi:SRPBCC family protein [Deminuibacter soli]|uniref:Cell division protein n=1 Tax=Deminuibacter soli TaxID=2291815 RepID=A0A3E1NQQ9_9BACT|nr:cell division protein [Deminuibacter soli]RFM30265.1 cell division protein [Deminuibacter soli]